MPVKETTVSSIKPVPFPGGACRPDQMEKWIKWKHSEQVARGLNDIAHGRIPEGKFKPLWDKEAITPLGSLPSKPSFSDRLDDRVGPQHARDAAREIPHRRRRL